jgi:hypothetical protein
MSMCLRFLSLIASALALAACMSDAGTARADFSVTDSAGVLLVRNDGDPAAMDSAAVEPVEVLRIGVVDGAPEYQFDQIYGLQTTEDGRIFAVNGGTRTIRVYDAQGRFLREFGGQGGGPHEFQSLGGLFVRGDTVIAIGSDKVAVFDTLGELRASWSTRREMPASASFGELRGSANISLTSRDSVGWLAVLRKYYYSKRYEIGRAYRDSLEQFRIDVMTGELGDDSLPPLILQQVRYAIAERGEMALAARLWEAHPVEARAADGRTYSSDGLTYAIEVRDPTGRLERRITRAHEPVPLGERELNGYRDLVRARFDSVPNSHAPSRERERARLLDQIPALGHPPSLQAIGRIMPMSDSTIWVSRPDLRVDPVRMAYDRFYGSRARETRSMQWDRFDLEGRYLGSLLIPGDLSVRQYRATELLGVRRDSLDVEYVVKLRVPR